MATIITKNSQTASAVPSAAQLSVGELAVNTADGRLFTEHSDGSVREVQGIAAGTGISLSRSNGVSTVTNSGVTAVAATSPIATSGSSGSITLSHANSGVTANTYGSASAIPVITVNAQGHITGVTTAAPSASAPTTAQVLSATAGATTGAVGTYAIMYFYDGTNTQPNSTRAGANLFFSSVNTDGILGTTSSSGTWRCMGYATGNVGGTSSANITLWLRIS